MKDTNQQGFPQISAPFVDNSGKILQVWLQLLITLWNRTGGGSGGQPKPFNPITVVTSPFIYTATASSNIWISPGTYCEVSIKRYATTLDFGKVTRGIFPLSVGDIATITYTTLPPTIYII